MLPSSGSLTRRLEAATAQNAPRFGSDLPVAAFGAVISCMRSRLKLKRYTTLHRQRIGGFFSVACPAQTAFEVLSYTTRDPSTRRFRQHALQSKGGRPGVRSGTAPSFWSNFGFVGFTARYLLSQSLLSAAKFILIKDLLDRFSHSFMIPESVGIDGRRRWRSTRELVSTLLTIVRA